MPLWRKTDATLSRPKWINLSTYPAGTQLVFVDETEAKLDANKKKGLTGTGWWLFREYTDSNGVVRYKSELLVNLAVTAAVAGDATDDTIAADVNAAITISVQPANQTTVAGAATFGVTAAVAPSGTLTYQWQSKAPNGRWTAVVGATAATLVLSGKVSGDTGTQYRVVLGSTSGAPKVTSNAATLTFGT